MGFAVAIPVAISAVKALLRYRARVDEILALKAASDPLPFALPPTAIDFGAQRPGMLAFFGSEQGRLVLEMHRFTEVFETVRDAPATAAQDDAVSLFRLYFESANVPPALLGPQPDAVRASASSEFRLAYSVVTSHRLSRNPAVTRILLATADTLLEVAGENAGMFLSNRKTEAIVRSLIQEFAGNRDFDDDSAQMILQSLLQSAVVAAMENQESITDEPAVIALFGALSDLRDDDAFGDEFVAKILTRDGFQSLVGRYLVQVADDPSFLVADDAFRNTLSATLRELGTNFTGILEDPKALFGVLEASLAAAAGDAQTLLQKKIGGKPLLTAVLVSVLEQVRTQGENNALLRSVASGEIVSDLFRAGMGAVAAHPDKLASAARIDALSANLVAGLADVLAHKPLADAVSERTLRQIASRSLLVLAENSAALTGDGKFATRVLASVLKAASSAVQDGLSRDDLADLADAAIRSATGNLALAKIDGTLEVVLAAVGAELSEQGVRALLSPDSRAEVVFASIESISINPVMWRKFDEADLVQPLVTAVIRGLQQDKSELLGGPTFVEALRGVLSAAARRGNRLLENEVLDEEVELLLRNALKKVAQEIGRTLDGENLPAYLRRIVTFYFDEPFELGGIADPAFKALHAKALETLEAA